MANNFTTAANLAFQGSSHYLSYLVTGDLNDIQEAVRCAREVFHLMPPDAPEMPAMLFELARALARRFLHTRRVEDITEAIKLFRQASQLLPVDSPMNNMCCEYMIFSFLLRHANLEGSIEHNDLCVCTRKGKIKIESLTCKLYEDTEVAENCMRIVDHCRRESQGPPLSLESGLVQGDFAIKFLRQALKFFSHRASDPFYTSGILCELGHFLRERYENLGASSDNDEAIDCLCRALELAMSTRNFISCLISASSSLVSRFEALRSREDIDNAVNYTKRALAHFDSGFDCRDELFLFCLVSLANVLVCRYTTTGDMNDLEAATCTSLRAVNVAEHTFKEHLPGLLLDVGRIFDVRFLRTRKSEELSYAIEIGKRAANLFPPQDPSRINNLVTLSCRENLLAHILQDVEYADEAVRHLDEARSCFIALPQSTVKLRFELYSAIASNLEMMGRWDDAIELLRLLSTKYPDDVLRSCGKEYFLTLSQSLFKRWTNTHKREDIDEAIIIMRRMIETCELAMFRVLLGNFLYSRYESTREKEDLKCALKVLLQGFQMSASTPFDRIRAGQDAVHILCELAEWDRARKLSMEIVDLLIILNGRSLQWTDKQALLHLFSNQAPNYASIALQAGSGVFDAIDILETCRGSILGQAIDNQTDLDDLKKKAPKQAERFSALRDDINARIDPTGSANSRVDETIRKDKSEAEIRVCLEEIRKLEGCHRFLLGPSHEEIRAAANEGPIVIVNVTSIRSDAIIITKDAAVLLRLPPELRYEKAKEFPDTISVAFNDVILLGKRNREFQRLLKWLWDNCVKLILEKLDDLLPGTTKFHVWWIGTGIASSFPFHAAGIYTGNVRETALSRAISSYTPTLKILLHGRRKLKFDHLKPDMPRLPKKPEMLIVSMPSTPGESDLENVQDEAEKVYNIVQGVYSARHSFQPSARYTMECMARCEVVHFACHGQSIWTDPSNSRLLLQATDPDSMTPRIDEMKLKDVAALNLCHGKLAFLSACSTAENPLTGLWDEGLHLVSAFHVAGYLHVIGNLWPANDEVSVQIAAGFYQRLVEAGELGYGHNVAKALNEALIGVSEELAKQPLCWAQFVHVGV